MMATDNGRGFRYFMPCSTGDILETSAAETSVAYKTPMNALNINVGVLGHVDSGKTSLVKALSSVLSTAALDKHPQVRHALSLSPFSCVNSGRTVLLSGSPTCVYSWAVGPPIGEDVQLFMPL